MLWYHVCDGKSFIVLVTIAPSACPFLSRLLISWRVASEISLFFGTHAALDCSIAGTIQRVEFSRRRSDFTFLVKYLGRF